MSSTRRYKHWWHPNVVKLLRIYPYLKALQQSDPDVVITPAYSGMPRGGGNSRPTENVATRRKLSAREEDLVNAVDHALWEVATWPDGAVIVRLVDMVDFKRRYTLEGAAMVLHMSRDVAYRKRSRFIYLVGKNCGF